MIDSTRRADRRQGAGSSIWYRSARFLGLLLWRSIEFVLALVVIAVALPIYLLPWHIATALGEQVGRIVYYFWPKARRVAMINLHCALGVGRRDAQRQARRVLGNMGRSIAEGVQIARRFRTSESDWERIYRAENPELERRILADPRPKVFVTGHLGSWEAAVSILSLRFGEEGAALIRGIDNPWLNWVVRTGRVRHRSQWIEKRQGIAEAMERLRSGKSIALLLDEDAGPRGLFVDFFDRPASTRSSAALLALLTQSPLVVGAAFREGRGDRFVFRLELIETESVTREIEAVKALTQQVTAVLEGWIRERPDEWRWIHWRWKHRPSGRMESYRKTDLTRCFRSPPC